MTKYSVLLLLAALVVDAPAALAVDRREVGPLVFEDVPEIPDSIVERQRQYQNSRSARVVDWHPQGDGLLMATRFGDTAQLHQITAPGAARKQITFFKEPIGSGSYAPRSAGHLVYFSKDTGGDENYQIVSLDTRDGVVRTLTDGENRHQGPVFSSNGARYAYSSPKGNGRDWGLYVANTDGAGEEQLLFQGEGWWMPGDWATDGRKFLAINYISASDSQHYIIDAVNGGATPLVPDAENTSYQSAVFNADGTAVYFTSDQGGEFRRLFVRDLTTGQETLLTGDIDWDVSSISLSGDGKTLAVLINADGIAELRLFDTTTHEGRAVPGIPQGLIGGLLFSPDSKQLALTLNRPSAPSDIYVLDLASNDLVRWTESEVGGLNTALFAEPDLIRFESFDGLTVPAFVYKPEGTDPAPVLIDIHGGPEAQSRPRYSPFTQYLVNELGVAVVIPNVRGSTGYGRSYHMLDNGFNREDSVKDIGALLDWIETQDDLDSDRVMVLGGSYGGYMVLASMVHFNDRLAGGIDVVGISNFVTFLESTKEYRRAVRRPEYGDERDPEMRAFLERISPNNNADKITKPLFVIQGLNDPRVPVTEAEQMVATIRENGGPVWYLMARDEGHGFRKKTNRDQMNAAMSLFIERYLLGSGS